MDLPQDIAMEAEVINATQAKNTLASEIRIMLRAFATRARLVFELNSGNYKRFHSGELSRFNDNDLYMFADLVSAAAVELLTELSTTGLTQIMIDELDAKIAELKLMVKTQSIAIAVRDTASNLRVKKANELFKLLMKYSDVGKNIWYEVNEALYNDYLIYDTQVGSISAPTNLSVDVSTMLFTWSEEINATSYVLEATTEVGGSDFEVIYSGPDNYINYTPTSEGLRSYRVRCRNSGGYSEYSNVMLYNYIAVLPQPGYISISVINAVTGAISILWEEISGATFYRLYHSQVAIGSPALEYTMIGEYSVAGFSGSVPTGYRHYFKVICGNSEKLSVDSDAIFVDMPLVP
jgi:hypothetical protein